MAIFKLLPVALLMLCVSACDGRGVNGERLWGRPGSPAWEMSASDQTKYAYYASRCQSYGFAWGTPWMAQCIAEETRAGKHSSSQAMSQLGASLSASQRMNQSPMTCTMVGNMMSCF